jgi:hypothetical protein
MILTKDNIEVKATPKQKLVVEHLMANPGAQMSDAIRSAGYSEVSARNPQEITRAKGFKELLDIYLPEKKLLRKHKDFINAKKVIRTYTKGDLTSEIEETDANAVKALDMAYKLRGAYINNDVTNNVLVVQLSDASSSRYALTPSAHVDALPVDSAASTPVDNEIKT